MLEAVLLVEVTRILGSPQLLSQVQEASFQDRALLADTAAVQAGPASPAS